MACAAALSCSSRTIHGVVSEPISQIICDECFHGESCYTAFLPKGLTLSKGILSGTPKEDVHNGVMYIYDEDSSFRITVDSEHLEVFSS